MIDINTKVMLMGIFMTIYIPWTFIEIRWCRAKTIRQEVLRHRKEREIDKLVTILKFSNRLHTIVRELDSKKAFELLVEIHQASECYDDYDDNHPREHKFEDVLYSNFQPDVLIVFDALSKKNPLGGGEDKRKVKPKRREQ